MEDYKEECKNLFLQYYSPFGETYQKIYLMTSEILIMMRGVIPNKPIDEHYIYEIMKEMGFSQEQEIVYEKICTYEGDEDKGIPAEFENKEVGRFFKWVVFQK